MNDATRERHRRETAARLLGSRAELSTTALGRVPRMAATSLRGGVLALLVKAGSRPGAPGNLESIHRIVASLGQLKGAAMKMGQHLSYVDSELAGELRAALAALQTSSQPMDAARVDALVAPLVVEHPPIAAATIGQVHRATLPDGRRVAVKVQYPGIAHAIATDFGPASLAGVLAGLLYPRAKLDGLVREARARSLDECDYRAEARHQRAFAARFAAHPVLAIPAVHDELCTDRVLVTDFVDGVHLDAFLAADPPEALRQRVGTALFEFYVGSLVRWNLLSGDPHPGNYLVTADGRVAILDHACTRSLPPSLDRLAIVRRVFDAQHRPTIYRAAEALGSDALLLLRLRFGLAAVLARLAVRPDWPSLIDAATAAPAWAPRAFEVVLLAAGDRMIEVVRHVRELTGAGIGEAKHLIEHPPWVVKRTADRREADELKQRLEGSGARVEVTEVDEA